MSSTRSRLAAHAAAAGYPPGLLVQIAAATLTRYRPGQHLADSDVTQVTDAVQVLAQAGYDAERLSVSLADYQARHGARWRERFWTRTVALAALRYRHPELYGISPCETDAERRRQAAAAPASAG